MGTRSADDDSRKPDGVTSPPEPVPSPWGEVVIPDDISELSAEAEQVRHELRAERRHRRWTRWLGGGDSSDGPGVVGPLFIVALAMTLAMTSLFGGFWPYQPAGRDSGEARAPSVGQQLPELTLADSDGTSVRLRELRPVVILAVGKCTCTNLIAETAVIARQERLTLAVVGQPGAPALPPVVEGDDPDAVRSLADPRGVVARTAVPDRAPRTGTAVVVLVNGAGSMTHVLNDVQSAEEFAAVARRLG
ncbi:MAG: hypothetical protein ACRDTM_17355 [Micromonosporaceae bacterium]